MTRKRHAEEQIIAMLKDAQAGISVQALCRKHGISDATFYTWRTKFAGLEVADGRSWQRFLALHSRGPVSPDAVMPWILGITGW